MTGPMVSSDSLPGKRARVINSILWVLQILLAVLFLFAGSMKLVLPIAAMTKGVPFPGAFLRFIGIAEVLGALGLVLPRGLRIKRGLTPLAALGLVVIMIGATSLMFHLIGWTQALMPFTVGCLLLTVVYGRRSEFTGTPEPAIQQNSIAAVDLAPPHSTN